MEILDEQLPLVDYRKRIRREIRNFLLGAGLFALPLALLFSYWLWELLRIAPESYGVLGLMGFMFLFGWTALFYVLWQIHLLREDYLGHRLLSFRATVEDREVNHFRRNGLPSYQLYLSPNAAGYKRCEVDAQQYQQFIVGTEVELVIGKHSKLLFKVERAG